MKLKSKCMPIFGIQSESESESESEGEGGGRKAKNNEMIVCEKLSLQLGAMTRS